MIAWCDCGYPCDTCGSPGTEPEPLDDGGPTCGALFDDGAHGAQRCARVPGHRGRHGTTTASRLAGDPEAMSTGPKS